MRSIRVGMAMAGVLLTVAVASPASAFKEIGNTGSTGFYTVPDYNGQAGVICRFEDNLGVNADELDSIRIAKVWTHGPLPQDTWVGYRYVVKANAKPYGDGVFSTVYTSPLRKATANDMEVAYFGPYTWNAPEGTQSRYKVKLQFLYYAPGSQSVLDGRASGLMEVYRHRLGTGSYDLGSEGAGAFCRRNYHFAN
jgi:hypothetical protein